MRKKNEYNNDFIIFSISYLYFKIYIFVMLFYFCFFSGPIFALFFFFFFLISLLQKVHFSYINYYRNIFNSLEVKIKIKIKRKNKIIAYLNDGNNIITFFN